MYRRQIIKSGETFVLRRAGENDATVRGRASGFGLSDVAGAVQQNQRMIVVLAEDVEASGFPAPFQANIDRVVWGARVMPITYADATKRRVAGVLIAYELHVAGK